MKSLQILFFWLFFLSAYAGEQLQPYATVKHYSFYSRLELAQPNNTGTFSLRMSQRINGYSITLANETKAALKDIPYHKTFGGRPPTVHIDLINNRYLIYPETIPDSADRKDQFNSMLAKINIYDLRARKTIYSSKTFRYDHDIPLDYKLRDLLFYINSIAQ